MYVRRERLEDAGSFMLLLLHTLAHVSTDCWDDRHASFLQHFYQCLETVCSEYFFTRSDAAQAHLERLERAQALKAAAVLAPRANAAEGGPRPESASVQRSESGRAPVVLSSQTRAIDDLVAMESPDPAATVRALHQRLDRYAVFHNRCGRLASAPRASVSRR